jgi:hypothetical protein
MSTTITTKPTSNLYGRLGCWPPIGLKPAFAVSKKERALLHKVNKAIRQQSRLQNHRDQAQAEMYQDIKRGV